MFEPTWDTDEEYIDAMMKRFKLVDMREQYRDLIQEAEASSMGYGAFLKRLMSVEETGKKNRRAQKLRMEARFEKEKRLEDITPWTGKRSPSLEGLAFSGRTKM